MPEQMNSPGSNADSSTNTPKTSAVKDKACPFCRQPFTSSSLGRHLDLYIKEKNPKPADGIHDVEEIQKMRGGITRRQPRNSTSKREDSTPAGTPKVNGDGGGKTSPPSEATAKGGAAQALRSPNIQRLLMNSSEDGAKGSHRTLFNAPTWHSTGVINDIPPVVRNGDSGKWDVEGESRKLEGRRMVSRQTLAKASFDQKQKLSEALDTARAAELALREVLGSIRAANRRVKPSANPFDYDPFAMDFPALTLHCLPPPPTLDQVTQITSPNSWSIHPPDQQQYEALRSHFREAFHSWRISCAITTSTHPDEFLSYGSSASRSSDDSAEIHTATLEFEEKVFKHLQATFGHWASQSQPMKSELWRLKLARAIGQKDHIILRLKSHTEKIQQENSHLRAQVEQLSRCQQPREFQMMPPATIPISNKTLIELGNIGANSNPIGVSIKDKEEPLEVMVEKAIGRWLAVVQSTKNVHSGLASQRALNGQPLNQGPGQHLIPTQSQSHNQNHMNGMGNIENNRDAEMSDVDAEGEENFDDLPSTGSAQVQTRMPEAPMGVMGRRGYSNGNGNNKSETRHDGTNGNSNGGMEMDGVGRQYSVKRVIM